MIRHLFFGAFLLAADPTVAQSIVEGPARVVDGDTLRVAHHRIRLLGIDAPERAQTCIIEHASSTRWPCGQDATQQLQALVEGEIVNCEAKDQDRYGRIVAVCFAGGRDLNDAMVRSGYAVATPQYSDRYIEAEKEAKQQRRGIWAGSFQLPADYRLRRR